MADISGSVAASVKHEHHHAPDMYTPSADSSRILWCDKETAHLLEIVPRHLDTRGEQTIVHWQEVAKDMRTAGYLRSAEALSAHFRAEHETMTQAPSHAATPPAPAAGETHPNYFWTAQEERELWRLTEKFADKTSGKIAWQKVHDQLAKDGHDRAVTAIKAHMHKMKAAA